MLGDINMVTRSALHGIVLLFEICSTERCPSGVKIRETVARSAVQGIVPLIQQTLVIVIYLLARYSGGTGGQHY